MIKFPKNLSAKLDARKQNNALRHLPTQNDLIDFASNDYLGFVRSEQIFYETHQYLIDNKYIENGASGSRLLSGNHPLYAVTEKEIAQFHQTKAALIFNSGYDANVGFFSSVPQKGDFILFDALCHASIRDGIKLSNANSHKFGHNDYEDLERLLEKTQTPNSEIYIVTESVFSMDGDAPNFETIVKLSEKYKAYIIVDEAHALGVYGEKGEGLIQSLNFQNAIFARIITFGKGLGCHGAAILGSQELKEYLINFARSFIYTTGLSPHAIAAILKSYQHLQTDKNALNQLRSNIIFFNREKMMLGLKPLFVYSKSAIQCAIIPGNEKVKNIAHQLQQKGFDVKAIISPTVPNGQERLRLCLHNFNSEKEISEILAHLKALVF